MITRNATITLREVTRETLLDVLRLDVSEVQRQYVASNAKSIAQAHFEPHAWFRAIYADDTPVGFVMLYDDPDKADYFLWRFMIDHRYQKLGFAKRALELLIAHVRTRPNATKLGVSCVPGGDASPCSFYKRMGFIPTGEVDGGEVVMSLSLSPA
jgi:diamine N-acetyltransferase